jgi:hypothetical protein
MGRHSKSLDKDFPKQSYQKQLELFSELLAERLSALDHETKWDDYCFAPLEAEVEVVSGRRHRRKLLDLMRALRAEQASRIVLVLGVLEQARGSRYANCRRGLLREVASTGRIPVYINLKEWNPQRRWSEQAPPTASELREFILQASEGQCVC